MTEENISPEVGAAIEIQQRKLQAATLFLRSIGFTAQDQFAHGLALLADTAMTLRKSDKDFAKQVDWLPEDPKQLTYRQIHVMVMALMQFTLPSEDDSESTTIEA